MNQPAPPTIAEKRKAVVGECRVVVVMFTPAGTAPLLGQRVAPNAARTGPKHARFITSAPPPDLLLSSPPPPSTISCPHPALPLVVLWSRSRRTPFPRPPFVVVPSRLFSRVDSRRQWLALASILAVEPLQ